MESEIRKEDAIQDDKKEKLKRKAFEKHKKIIELTIMCGNQVALVPQLIEILLNTNTYKNKKQVYDALTLLEKHKLIYKKDFGSCKYIELRNPAIKWAIEGLKERYGDLYSTNKKGISDEMIYTSMFKFEYLIEVLEKLNNKDLQRLIDITASNSTVIYTKGRGRFYFDLLLRNTKPQLGEFKKMQEDLSVQYNKQKLSLIKGDNITREQKVIKEFCNNYELQFDEYNFNSILGNNCLMLELKDVKKPTDYDVKLYFTLNIFDLRNTLNPKDIVELSERVYNLLFRTFKGPTVDTLRTVIPLDGVCANCDKCIYNKKAKKPICDPQDESDQRKCNEVAFKKMDRNIYLEIRYLAWDKKSALSMHTNVNQQNFENGMLSKYGYLKDKIVKNNKKILSPSLYDKYIKFNSINYDLERYGVNKGEDNITEYNERQEQKAIYKEEVKNNDEFLQILLFLKDNFELLQLLKDNLEDFRAYLISNSIPNNLIENTDVKEEEEIMKYYEENFNLIDEEIEENILEFDINDVEY